MIPPAPAVRREAEAEPGPPPGGGSRRGLGLAALAALALALFAAPNSGGVSVTERAAPEPDVKILASAEVLRLALINLSESLALSGETAPARRAVVSAEVGGLADPAPHRPGDPVRAGEILLAVAAEDRRLTLQAKEAERAGARARLLTAQAALDRVSRLAERGLAAHAAQEEARSAAEEASAAFALADSGVRLAAADLARATIRAPISGILASRAVEAGELVQAGAALFEIVDLSSLRIEALVPLTRAARLREGMAAEFWPPETPERRVRARLLRVNPQAEAGTRAAKVWFEIETAESGLRGGMFLVGAVETSRAEGRLALPRAALRRQGESAAALTIREGKAVLTPVTLGAAWKAGELVEILSGLRAGDLVVALPLAGLAPGDSVRIAED